MRSETRRLARPCREAALLLASLISVNVIAQAPPPQPPPQGSQQVPPIPQQMLPMPQQLPALPTTFDPSNAAGTSPRFLFAGALALVAKSVGASVVNGLSQGIVNWFNARAGQPGGTPGAVAPWMPPPPMGGDVAGAYFPGSVPASPPMSFPATAGAFPTPGAGPGGPAAAGMIQPPGSVTPGSVPNAPGQPSPMSTPYPVASGSPPLPGAMAVGVATALYAGIAFEVHLLGPGGSETAVDPATYIFHSGDRFLVYYRPSLPGRVRVSNVSPIGEVIPIESLTLAAGELAKLGPYQLTDPVGDEALRLVLEPCSTPELVAATRNIVKAADTGLGSDLHISSCQTAAQPAAGLATRNIVKATMDGSTGFALDPVNSQELASGRLAPRETSITIHHR
jgi:hypothetical protein